MINNEPFSCSPGSGTNNEAEYYALINLFVALLDRMKSGDSVEICGDSDLIISQIKGNYAVKSLKLQPLWTQANIHVLKLRDRGCAVSLEWHPREENKPADTASKRAIGIDPEKEKASRVAAPGYGTLSEAAKLAGCSA